MANNSAEDRKLAESPEMSNLFRVLAIANANVVHRVMKPTSTAKKIERATMEIRRLVSEANLAGNHKCPPGTIWDESLRRCVPLIKT
jgi:hypothetical protein